MMNKIIYNKKKYITLFAFLLIYNNIYNSNILCKLLIRN